MNFSFLIFSVSSDLWPGAENKCKERTMPSGEKPTSVCTSSQYSPWLYIAYHLPRDDLCSRYNMRYPFPFFLIHPILKIPFSLTCLHRVLSLTSVLRTRLLGSPGIIASFVRKKLFLPLPWVTVGRDPPRLSSSACYLIRLSPVLRENSLILYCTSSICSALSAVKKLNWIWDL